MKWGGGGEPLFVNKTLPFPVNQQILTVFPLSLLIIPCIIDKVSFSSLYLYDLLKQVKLRITDLLLKENETLIFFVLLC